MESIGDGDICWFKCSGYPVWPGLIVPDERLPKHIKKSSQYNPKKIAFIYYGARPLDWGFVSSKDVMDFETNKEKYIKQSKENTCKYKKQLAVAIAEAEIEANKTKEERFKIITVDEDDQSGCEDLVDEDVDNDEDDDVDDDDDDESTGNISADSSSDTGKMDIELDKILDTNIVTSLSQYSDDEYSSNKDDVRGKSMTRKRKIKETSNNKSRSESKTDSKDLQNNQKLKKLKVKKNTEKNINETKDINSTNVSDIIKLKSTNIPVWQQLQQQQQQQRQQQSNSSVSNFSQNIVDDTKVKRLSSYIKLLEQYKANENMNATKSICIINELEKDTYTYDELRVSKAAEFITNLRQSSNLNVATAASKLRNIWKAHCQKVTVCDKKNVSDINNRDVIANVEKKPSVSQIENILKNTSNDRLNQRQKIKEDDTVSTNETSSRISAVENTKVILDTWNLDKLSTELKNNIFRRRAIRLIHDSVKRISIAIQLEELCFKKYWNYIPNDITPPDCYLEHIRFVTFNLLEPHQYYLLQQCQLTQNVPNSLLESLVNSYHS